MRISVRPLEGWETVSADFRADVYCDERELKGCVRVDTDAGVAVVHKRDEQGKLVIEGEEIAQEEVHGCMRVVVRSGSHGMRL